MSGTYRERFERVQYLLGLISSRVYGKPEKFNHTISLRLENIREIQDPHEIYFHTMEAMVSTLQYARGPTVNILYVYSVTLSY